MTFSHERYFATNVLARLGIKFYTVFQKKTTPFVFLHNTQKYQPISMKISENIAEGMLNVKYVICKKYVFLLNILCQQRCKQGVSSCTKQVRWETKNTCRWPILLVISVPKIFANGQFYFNLSSKMWSRVFFGTQCISCIPSLLLFN